MRRLIVECPTGELDRVLGDPITRQIESLEVISFLRFTKDEAAMICRVKFNGDVASVKTALKSRGLEMQILEQGEGGICTCFMRKVHQAGPSVHDSLAAGGYLSTPYEIRDGKVRATFVGNGRQIRRILETIEGAGIRHRVISLIDAQFPPGSPLGHLTEKQQRALTTAFRLGYYDIPKRTSSEELAKRLKVRPSTFVVRRKRAERRLLAEIIGP
jgi:predicted DNA binding protein